MHCIEYNPTKFLLQCHLRLSSGAQHNKIRFSNGMEKQADFIFGFLFRTTNDSMTLQWTMYVRFDDKVIEMNNST